MALKDDPRAGKGDRRHPPAALPETPLRAIALLDDILQMTARDDPRFSELLLLRHQLNVDEKQFEEARKTLAEFEEVYKKLTAPANRIATFLGAPDAGVANIAVGDTEYYSNADPRLEIDKVKVGTRVKVNEAFAVVGDLGYPTSGSIVKVREVLGDGRLRVSMDAAGSSGKVVLRSSDLAQRDLKPGDEVRLEANGRVAVEVFPTTEMQDYYFEEVPEIPWSRVGGQEKAIQVIRDAIELPLLYPELYARFDKKPLKGILLYGPPGCGKTLIGKATAYNLTQEYRKRTGRDVKQYFMYINGPKILNMWVGESERMVREIFASARARAKDGNLVFIFIDEAEALLRTRSSGRVFDIGNTVVPQFSAEMDGLVSAENVVVMLTSNRPDYIDPAILRPQRIDRKVKVARPNRAGTREILGIYLTPESPLDPELVQRSGSETAAREELIERTLDYLYSRSDESAYLQIRLRNARTQTLYWSDLISGALIMSVVERAKDSAIRRAIEMKSSAEGISWEDLQWAIRLEYKENEIFPKTDAQEDWLKLLDYEPENVVEIHRVRTEQPSGGTSVV
jgi:proteasome-associated ATPase